MDIFISVVLLCCTLGGGIIAIPGTTWDADKAGLLRLTRTGRVALGLLLVALGFGIWSSVRQSRSHANEQNRRVWENQTESVIELWRNRIEDDIKMANLERLSESALSREAVNQGVTVAPRMPSSTQVSVTSARMATFTTIQLVNELMILGVQFDDTKVIRYIRHVESVVSDGMAMAASPKDIMRQIRDEEEGDEKSLRSVERFFRRSVRNARDQVRRFPPSTPGIGVLRCMYCYRPAYARIRDWIDKSSFVRKMDVQYSVEPLLLVERGSGDFLAYYCQEHTEIAECIETMEIWIGGAEVDWDSVSDFYSAKSGE
ncbi:MAG: hypothetical protein GY778_02665 [bacterium]|nr:hypothetical protein [bacterium]